MTHRRPAPTDPETLVRKGVQFDVPYQVWEKFKYLAAQEGVTVPDLVVELVRGYCQSSFSPLDAEAGRRWPGLIGF